MSGSERLDNVNPRVHGILAARQPTADELDDAVDDPLDAREVFDMVRGICDPEHPLTLEQLHVVTPQLVSVDDGGRRVSVQFTPTIPHCSMATLIGLSVRVKLQRSLPPHIKLDVRVQPGTHASEAAVNRQLADKERVAAATENSRLVQVVNQCLAPVTH